MAAMRVVAGALKGRRIVAPRGRDTRPTSGQVREAVFNALNSLDVVEAATVLDLFAGSGALGIEALSRGAKRCTFVDQARSAIAAIRTNVETCAVAGQSTIVNADALAFVDHSERYDLVLADPPYGFKDWAALLARIDAGFVVLESDHPLNLTPSWVAVREKAYGTTVVTFAERAVPAVTE
ncbi:MAG: 16S rRNA (guanine(966)-N(2))-methyltransferase RsmD [Acidimicrobiales bacterium]